MKDVEQTTVRMPKDMREYLHFMATKKGISIHAVILFLLNQESNHQG